MKASRFTVNDAVMVDIKLPKSRLRETIHTSTLRHKLFCVVDFNN